MEELFKILIDKLKTIPLIESARIFNNQIINIEKETTLKFPTVLLELTAVKAMSRPQLEVQDFSATLRLHVVYKSDKQSSSTKVYTIKDQVHQYMNAFSGEGKFMPLRRTGEVLDYNHGNMYSYVIEYALNWKEVTPPVTEKHYVSINSINLKTDLDIDNPDFRTGDNKGYVFE